MRRPTICVDFDGVIHSYTTGWHGVGKVADPPMSGAIDWLKEVLDSPGSEGALYKSKVQVVIYSSRSQSRKGRRAMRMWFGEYLGWGYLAVLKFPKKKPAAFLTIDDRAICFKGTFPTIDQMLDFKPWKPVVELQYRESWEPIDPDDDVFTMEHFIENCKAGGFIDYDGFGNYARNVKKVDGVWTGEKLRCYEREVRPSHALKGWLDKNYKYVVWYNR